MLCMTTMELRPMYLEKGLLYPQLAHVDLSPVFGFLVIVLVTAYMVRFLQWLLGSSKRATVERAEEMGNEDDGIPLTARQQSRQGSQVPQSQSFMALDNLSPAMDSFTS